ncbi:unnamed protein product [Auanema sp. JU1783]|nr:unnamed protein product [Auanema sp. JU1783]
MVHSHRRTSIDIDDDDAYELSNEAVAKSSPRSALEKCARSLVEIHRLLRETSESMSSKESTPSDAATANHARKKWSAAFRVVQGLHRFKLPLHPLLTPYLRLQRFDNKMTTTTMNRRRMSLPQTPMSTPLLGVQASSASSHLSPKRDRRTLPPRPIRVSSASTIIPPEYHLYARQSEPDLYSTMILGGSSDMKDPLARARTRVIPLTTMVNSSNPTSRPLFSNQTPPPSQPSQLPTTNSNLPRRFLRRAHQSDLATRFQREREMHYSNESTPSREIEDSPVDPVYLALKQATGKYGRRGSSANNLDSGTPSPRNLSQVSLQDSGYVDMSTANHDPMLGSTPHLDNAGRSTGRRRAPKLTTQMKSLSLDYQEMPPKIQAANRSPLRSKLAAREYRGKNSASDLSDWDRSCSPCTVTSRRSSASLSNFGGHIVIHEYCPPNNGPALQLGERIRVVDNGDPDWLHGFRANDRTEYLMSFPATCVAPIHAGEQPMRIQQNIFVAEQKLRMYRDQIVFAQPDTLQDGKVTVRTEHNAFAACPLSSLALLTLH